jgi:EmrB/QacA subfamily drug resistance transporter
MMRPACFSDRAPNTSPVPPQGCDETVAFVCPTPFSALLIRKLPEANNIRVNPRINYLLLTTALLGTFFSGTATRLVNISMPTIASSLGTDLIGISWALLSYQLSNIGLSIIFGRVSDLWGREKVFALGFFVLSVSALLCGFSQSLLQLIVFRFIQGVGGAMIQSSSRALAAESVPEELGGRAQGYMTTAHHTGFMLGPGIGGVIIDYLSWRWSFFFLVPIGLCGMLLTLASIKRGAPSSRRQAVSIDYLGAVCVVATTTTLVLIFDRHTAQIIGTQVKFFLALLFLLSLGGLLLHESRAKSPFVNLSLFKLRLFTLSCVSLLIIASCYTLTGFLLPFYLQDILHLSPSYIGFLFMMPSILTVAAAPISGYMTDRLGPRFPASLGVAIMFFSLLVGGLLRPDSSWWLPTLLIVVGAITNGIFNPANSMAMIGMMPREHRGFASAMNHVTFGLGNVLGVSFGGFLMAAAFDYHTGLKGVSPTASDPAGFVAALNTTFLAAAGLSLVALLTSAMRGKETPIAIVKHSL